MGHAIADRLRFVVLAGLVLGGCGDDEGAGDAATDGASADGGIAAPDIPWLAEGVPPIAIAPCPAGWREVHDSDVVTCDPYPEAGPAACGLGEEHFPGGAGCEPIGEPCPTGDFATDLPSDTPVIYVRADAPAGGDGTLASPYTTLSDVGWPGLADDTTVALGKGTYEGTLVLNPSTRLVGACAAETVLTGAPTPAQAVIRVARAGDGAFVGNLAIVGAPQIGVLVDAGQTVSLEGVLIESALSYGVQVAGTRASLTARALVVRGTLPGAIAPGVGLYAADGAQIEATRAVVSQNQQVGVFAGNAAVVLLFDTAVRDTRAREADGMFGRGINVQRGAQFHADRTLVSGSREVGIQAGSDAEVVLSRVVVRDTQAQESDLEAGFGINVEDGARLEARQVLVSESHTAGVAAATDTELVLSDVVVRDTKARPSDGAYGRGINLDERVVFRADRLLVSSNRDVGIAATTDSDLVLSDVIVRDTQVRESDGTFGRGINIEDGARLDATRLVISDNREIGVAADGAPAMLTDVVVQSTMTRESGLVLGYGMSIQHGARLTGTRIAIDGAREIGLSSLAGGVIELSDLTVTNTEASARGYGHAVTAFGGTTHLTRFGIRTAATCGLFVANLGELAPSLDVESGVVEGAAIGACVQVDGYDLGRLTEGVVFRDNGVNLDSTMLPVPEPPSTLAP